MGAGRAGAGGRAGRRRGGRGSRGAAGGHPEGFRAAGRALGALALPTVAVQEGGYDLSAIGMLVRETLAGLEEGMDG